MKRYCPCGRPIERKPRESKAAYEKRQYCDPEHRTKYYRPGPPKKAFGIQVPSSKVQRRVGHGLLNYLYDKPV